jgi:hypothetical protein
MFPGTLAHVWLEAWYNSGLDNGAAWNAMSKVFRETDLSMMDWSEIDDIWETVQQVTKNYATKYAQHDATWQIVATELTFAIPLDDEIGYTGTIDLIVRDKRDGKIYFLDHKTTSSLDSYDKNSDLDRQISRYWWALQQLISGKGLVKVDNLPEYMQSYHGDDFVPIQMYYPLGIKLEGAEIGGFIYNLILKDYPVPPKVLKNGSLSKDKSQKTTYEMYMNALKEQHLNTFRYNVEALGKDASLTAFVEPYKDMLIHLANNPKEFFRRINVHRTQSEIDASIEELYATALDMKQAQLSEQVKWGTTRIYRNITHECPWCPFQPLCAAEIRGDNVQFLKDSLYTVEPTER